MSAEFNIPALFEQIFGRKLPKEFRIGKAPAQPTNAKLGQPFYEDDLYGREVFLPINFFIPVNGNLLKFQVPFGVMTISRQKNIVETIMVERNGTVKELISAEDYVISVKGIIVRPDGQWPEDDIQALKQLQDYNQSVVMRSALSDIFLSGEYEHRVVVKRFNMPASSGTITAKAFELDLVSDSIFELEL